jgi:BatD DUF11 like domain
MVTVTHFAGRRRVILWGVILSWLLALSSQGQSFSAQWESAESVAAGDPAVLQLIFTDCGQVSPPTLPPIDNAVTQYMGQSQELRIINGVRSSSIIFRYSVTPKSSGSVSIPALTVTVEGQKLTSRPLRLQVGQGFDSSQIGTLSLEVPKSDVYVGETIPVTIRFQFRHSPARQEPPSLKMDGFLRGRQTSQDGRSENINGEAMGVARWTMAVTAVKAGDLELGPAEFPTIYVFQSRRRRGGPFDDPFFGQFLGGNEQRQINFQSEPVRLHVIPPPSAGRPPQFNGAVGRFRMEISASPTNVSVGDPITVKVKVIGRGSFDGLSLPELPADSGFQAYPGTNSFEPSDALGLEGVKTFEEVLVPERTTLRELTLPPLAYWDPSAKRYGLAEARALPLTVRPNANAAIPGGPSPAALSGTNPPPSNPNTELRPLKPDLGRLVQWSPPLVNQGWYYGGVAFPPLAVLAFLTFRWWQRRPRDRSMDQLSRRRAEIRDGLVQMKRFADAGQAAACYQAANQVLQEQLGLLLGQSGGAYTEEVIETALVPRGFDAEAADSLRDLFHASARARFAGDPSAVELDRICQAAEQAVRELQKLEGRS